MKKILVVTAVLVLALGVIGCAQTQTPAPPPDIPRYTADQVIAIAAANSPSSGSVAYMRPAWTAEYIGNGRWVATKRYVLANGQEAGGVSREQWDFYESTGKLTKR